MKKLLLGITMLCLWSAVAQVELEKNDTIFTVSGALIEAQVTKVTEDAIHYNYPNEQLVNEIGVNTIVKIIFANGRIQHFSEKNTLSVAPEEIIDEMEKAAVFTENSLSILPFSFKKGADQDNEASEIATDHAYEFIKEALKENDLMLQETIVTAKRLDAYEIDLDNLQNIETDVQSLSMW